MGSLAILVLLLTFRFHEIAKFAAFGADSWALGKFVLYQIPYILPAVIPIAALLAAYILATDLSKSNELTSLRACGVSLRSLIAPLVCLSLSISIVNFVLISEVATYSHMQSRLLEREFKSINPLVLLKHPDLLRMKGIEISTLGELIPGESASKLVIAMPHPKLKRLALLFADQLEKEGETIVGEQMTLAVALEEPNGEFPPLILDSSKTLLSPIETFSRLLVGEGGKVSSDYLPLSLLIWKIKESYRTGGSPLAKLISDLFRRISIGLAPFTFALLGLAFGFSIGRSHSRKNLAVAILLASLYLSCFFFAKSFDKVIWLSLLLYLVPHMIILLATCRRLRSLSMGVA